MVFFLCFAKKYITMSKDNHFTGQTVYSQVLNPNRSLGFLCVVRQREILMTDLGLRGLTFEKINPEVLFYGASGRVFMLFGVLPDSNISDCHKKGFTVCFTC